LSELFESFAVHAFNGEPAVVGRAGLTGDPTAILDEMNERSAKSAIELMDFRQGWMRCEHDKGKMTRQTARVIWNIYGDVLMNDRNQE